MSSFTASALLRRCGGATSRLISELPSLASVQGRAEAWKIAGIVSLFIAAFAGRFSFDRFVHDASRTSWLELRVWFTLIAFAAWAMAAKKESRPRSLDVAVPVWLALLACLYAYLVGNWLLIGEHSATPTFAFETVMMGIQLFLAFRLVESVAQLLWLARAAVLAGMILFGFCLLGFGNPDVNGSGWAPFGGPITFYRIEFFGFCCALLLYATSSSRWSWLYLLSAAVLLFSALASLSKAAFLASLAVIAALLFWLLMTSRFRWAAMLAAVAALSYLTFFLVPGGGGAVFVARVSEAGDVPVERFLLDIRECPDRRPGQGAKGTFCVKERKTGKIMPPEQLPAPMQEQLRSLVAAYGHPDKALPIARVVELASRIVLLRDGSGRLAMAARAWDMFKSNRWFGAGIGTFELGALNQYTKEVMINRYPHNIGLEMAATAGIVGLALFGLATFGGLLAAQRCVRARPHLAFLMAYAPFVLIASIFGGDLFDYRVFWLALAFLVASTAQTNSPQATRTP